MGTGAGMLHPILCLDSWWMGLTQCGEEPVVVKGLLYIVGGVVVYPSTSKMLGT